MKQVIRGLGISWGVYAALCVVGPLAWGLAAAWIFHRLPEVRRMNSAGRPREESGRRTEDYDI